MKCRKCGQRDCWANGLCRNCHNQFYYASKTYGITLKEFVKTNEKLNHHKKGGIKFDDFLKVYDEQKGQSITDLSKQVGVSRETIYKYIKQYDNQKGKQSI